MMFRTRKSSVHNGALRLVLGLSLSFGVALPAVMAIGAQAAQAGQWKLTDTKARKYFLADDQLDKTTTRTKAGSTLVSVGTEARGHATKRVRDNGTPKAVETSEEVAGAKSLLKKFESRYLNTYETWPVDTIKITTTTTPFTDFDVTEWEEARKEIFRVTYRVRDDLTWRDPLTAVRYTETITYDETANETQLGPWAAKSASKKVGTGNDVKVDRQKVATRTDSKLIKKAAAPDATGPAGVGSVGVTSGFTADAGEGASSARSTAYKQTLTFSGAEKTKAKGGGTLSLEALLAAAAQEPDLLDDAGRLAWKLTAEGQVLLFTPYDAKGGLEGSSKVRLEPGVRTGKGPQGAEISISDYSVRPLALLGDFRRPGGGKKSARLTAH